MRKKEESQLSKGAKILEFKKPVPKPNVLDLEEAFREVFPLEKLKDAEFTKDGERVIITLHSELPPTRGIKTRTYAHYSGSYKDLFLNTPELD